MRCGRWRILGAGALAILGLFNAPRAHAQDSDSGIDDSLLWTAPCASVFASVCAAHRTETGRILVGAVATYRHRPVVLRHQEVGAVEAVSAQADMDFLFAMAFLDFLDVGLVLPLTLLQYGAGTSPITTSGAGRDRIEVLALRDLRLETRWRLLDAPLSLDLVIGISMPTGGRIDFSGSDQWVPYVAILPHRELGRFVLGGQAAFRYRAELRRLGTARFGSTVVLRLGGAWYGDDARTVALSLEPGMRLQLASQPPAAEESQHAFDILVGVRLHVEGWEGYALRAAFGVAGGGFGAPAFYFLLGADDGQTSVPDWLGAS